MRETIFGTVHTYQDLHLIEQQVLVGPPPPKLNIVDVPGANGSKDLSDLPAGDITYADRTISWTYALYPGDDWASKISQVEEALNGKRCHIILHGDPSHYYDGRVIVRDYQLDGLLRQITVEAICKPFKGAVV